MTPMPATFEAWLNRLPGFHDARVVSVTPVDGGASNITCRVELLGSGPRVICLRMERDQGIFQPYDVIREGRVIAALAGSEVPVPAIIASEPSPRPLGAPFIVMEWVDAPHMGVAPHPSFANFTSAVAAIHNADWRGLGLAFLGAPASPQAGILAELDSIEARMPAFACEHDPLLRGALALLREHAPADGRLALCQGDINIFNYLFRGEDVVAVVDWEQARISDPRSDVGQLLALSHLKGSPFGPADSQPFALAYGAASGTPLSGMAYFRARWLFELGVIYHGWVRFNASEPWYTLEQLTSLLQHSLTELD